MSRIIREAFVTSTEEAIHAQNDGADRVLLAGVSQEENVTPDLSTIARVVQEISIDIKVLIQPKVGSFVYHSSDINQMLDEIEFCKSQGIYGVALGCINTDGETLNLKQITQLAHKAAPLHITVHRAIDLCKDPVQEALNLQKTGLIHSVLSSGGSPTLEDGLTTIQLMTTHAPDLSIIATGGVNKHNVAHFNQHIVTNEFSY